MFYILNYFFDNLNFIACLLYTSIYDYNYLVSIQDWSALLDTSAFISKITFVIMCIVIVFNFIVYMKNK